MRRKSNDSWLKLMGSPLRKRLEDHDKSNLCLWRGLCAHEGEKWGFLTTIARGSPTKKDWRSPKKQLVFMKGNMCTWENKCGFLTKLIGGPLRKRLENHQKSNLCVWRGMCAYEGDKPLLMAWAVSCFYCWCLELFHASVADVLSCFMLLLLMSWAVSRFCCSCL